MVEILGLVCINGELENNERNLSRKSNSLLPFSTELHCVLSIVCYTFYFVKIHDSSLLNIKECKIRVQ